MNKKTIGSAALILLSLGLSACSGWGGSGGSSDKGTPTNPNNIVNNGSVNGGNTGNNTGSGNANNNSGNNSSAGNVTGNNTSRPNSGSGANSGSGNNAGSGSTPTKPSTPQGPTPEELAKKAEEEARKAEEEAKKNKLEQAKASVTGYFVNGSAALDAATDEATKLVVKGTVDNSTGTCDINPTNCTNKDLPKGTVLSTEKQSYSSYAVLRETFNEAPNTETTPVNSFVYFAEAPTTDKSKVVDADYIGKADWSQQNKTHVNRDFNFKLFVRNSKVDGAVYLTGWDISAIKLNEAEVKVTNGAVGFNGTATFSGTALGTGFNGDFSGTYKGVFSGENAEEVAGTFESDTIEPTKSVQGAFVGKK